MNIQFYSEKNPKLLEIACYKQLNFLAHAQIEELEIGSRCGGHGQCGGDRIQLEEPHAQVSPITEAEKIHLTPDEINQGWRLACQCWPENSEKKYRVKVEIK